MALLRPFAQESPPARGGAGPHTGDLLQGAGGREHLPQPCSLLRKSCPVPRELFAERRLQGLRASTPNQQPASSHLGLCHFC